MSIVCRTKRPETRLLIDFLIDLKFKGTTDPIHFIFEIIVGKSRIRHRTTLDFLMINDISISSKSIEYAVIEIQSRSMSDPTLSDIDLKMAQVWTTLKLFKNFRKTLIKNHIF